MGTARFNENGELVDVDTGKVISNINDGPMMFNSNECEPKALQDLGVSLPQIPQEQWEDEEDKQENENITLYPEKQQKKPQINKQEQIKSHMDVGKSSFITKKSKYEVTPQSYFMIQFGLFQMEDGRFMPIKKDLVKEYKQSEYHWVKFRMWTYDEQLLWKAQCTEYNANIKSQFVNNDKLNERKIKSLMLDWSFGEYSDRLKLLHCDGKLSDQSYNLFKGLYPSIANTIVDLMNLVLESNQ